MFSHSSKGLFCFLSQMMRALRYQSDTMSVCFKLNINWNRMLKIAYCVIAIDFIYILFVWYLKKKNVFFKK